MPRLLKEGDRIRLKVRTMFGWKGLATVTMDQHTPDGSVWFRKDGDTDDWLHNLCTACRHEVSLIRKQPLKASSMSNPFQRQPAGARKSRQLDFNDPL